ncbi:hypothetical protein GGI07_003558 [Coemansia sp. Benny D115]|nr:hypothetical protein GGI07_003558 [Coemansia sp. Benny D115]
MFPSSLPALAALFFAALAHASARMPIGGETTSQRIIGGKPAPLSSFPSVVSLQILTASGVGFCGGTLVTDSLVVTAAHCVYNYNTGGTWPIGGMRVGLGNVVLAEQHFDHVLSVHVHPDFDPREPRNDIAVLEIPSITGRVGGAAPATIYTGSLEPRMRLTAVGWGRTTTGGGGRLPDRLQQTEIAVGEVASCRRFVPRFESSNGPQICTENRLMPGTDTCQGDSGTGVFAMMDGRMYLAGLTSYGANLAGDPTCALNDGYAIYTHVAYYRAFIDGLSRSLNLRKRRQGRRRPSHGKIAVHARPNP